ncbi:MAG: peptidoglycan-binding domain-containing protein [Elainella sp.]
MAIGLLSLTAGLALGLVRPSLSQEQESPAAPAPAAPGSPSSVPTATSRPTLSLGSQGTAVAELQSLLKLLGFYNGVVDGQYQASTAEAVSAFQQAVSLQPDGIVGSETWSRLLPAPPPIQQATAPSSGAPSPVTPNPGTPNPVTPSPVTPSPTAPGSRPSFPVPTASPAPVTPAPATPAPVTPAPTTPTPPPAPAPAPSPAPSPAPTPSYTPATPAPAAENPVLRVGSTGDAVTRLQERLQALGVFSGAIDGAFGAETEAAVLEAQRQFGLEPDGVVGPATWEALLRR